VVARVYARAASQASAAGGVVSIIVALNRRCVLRRRRMKYKGHVYSEALSRDYVSVIFAGALGIGARSKRAIVAHTLFRAECECVSREWVDRTDDDRSWTCSDGRCLRMMDRLQYVNHADRPNLVAV
jgi:hypothetical protein